MEQAFLTEYGPLYGGHIPRVKLSLLKMLLDKNGDGSISMAEAESFTVRTGGLFTSFTALVGPPGAGVSAGQSAAADNKNAARDKRAKEAAQLAVARKKQDIVPVLLPALQRPGNLTPAGAGG